MSRFLKRRPAALPWLVFGLVAAAYVLGFFHRVAPATLAQELTLAFHLSGAELGGLAAAYFLVYGLMQAPTGVLVDSLGPRRMVSAGSFLAAAGSALFALAAGFGQAVTGRLLVGLGVSVIFVSLLKLIAAWFPERRFATMSGLAVLLGNLGAVAAAAPLALALTVASWRSIFLGLAVLSALAAALVLWAVRDRPADLGLPGPGTAAAKPSRPRDSRARWRAELAAVAGNPDTWPAMGVAAGVGGSYFAFAGLWAVPYLMAVQDLSRELAALHGSVLLLGTALGSAACGAVSDRLRSRRAVLLAFLGLYAGCWLPLLSGAGLGAAGLPLFFLMGFSGSAFVLVFATVKELNDPRLPGTATGVANAGMFLAAAALQPLAGWVMDLSGAGRSVGDWRLGLGLLFLACLAGLAAAWRLRETGARNVFALPRAA